MKMQAVNSDKNETIEGKFSTNSQQLIDYSCSSLRNQNFIETSNRTPAWSKNEGLLVPAIFENSRKSKLIQ